MQFIAGFGRYIYINIFNNKIYENNFNDLHKINKQF